MAASTLWQDLVAANAGQLVRELRWKDLLFTNVRLNFNMQAQTQSNWCWAATSTSVSLFYRPSSGWTQCKVASAELNLTCCVSPVPGTCNVPWYLDRALQRTGNFVSITGTVAFTAVQTEIQAGRVLGARIGWSGGGGHFMAIYGCGVRAGTQYFDIDDPIYGKSSPSVSVFTNSYQGSGHWTHTYFTKAAPVRFKFPEFKLDERLLRRISELRPIITDPRLARASLEEAADVQVTLPHEIETVGLAELARDEQPHRADAGVVRVIQIEDGQPRAFLDLTTGAAPDVAQIGDPENDYVRRLEQGLDALTRREAVRGGAELTELKLLRIPALYTEALVMREGEDGEEIAVVIRSVQPDVPLFEPLPVSDLLDRLREPARVMLSDDDPLKGA